VISMSAPKTIVGHDCSTLGGNSGSPVLALDTAEVVGLHFGGSFLWRNEAVTAPILADFVSKHA
jgi:endonuclease G